MVPALQVPWFLSTGLLEVQGPQVKYWVPTLQGIPSLGNCALGAHFFSSPFV